MPLEKAEDHALGDVSQVYCRYCTDKSGRLLPYDTILESNVGYYKESQGISDQAARKLATDLLRGQPAWKRG
jgi:hypothetical protein